MNVLSLFDGMSCGRSAVERAGFEVTNYFASEIDRYAISVAQYNYPDTIQLGDVQNWREWNLPKIDLLLAGSPCQGFSLAGKGLNFEDPRSKLFFEFYEILMTYSPKYFLLENVPMKKMWEDVITDHVGVDPIEINSALVSAQNRRRLYWTDIPNVEQPADREIYLRDILLEDAVEPVLSNVYHGFGENKTRIHYDKSVTIRPSTGGGHVASVARKPSYWGVAQRGRYEHDGSTSQRYELSQEEKANALTTVQKDSLYLSEAELDYMSRRVNDGRDHWDFGHHSDVENSKSSAVVANFFKGVPYNVLKEAGIVRKFHPVECERLQTVPDNYTQFGRVGYEIENISNTQRYRMLGNGWTVEVIAHILREMDI